MGAVQKPQVPYCSLQRPAGPRRVGRRLLGWDSISGGRKGGKQRRCWKGGQTGWELLLGLPRAILP